MVIALDIYEKVMSNGRNRENKLIVIYHIIKVSRYTNYKLDWHLYIVCNVWYVNMCSNNILKLKITTIT